MPNGSSKFSGKKIDRKFGRIFYEMPKNLIQLVFIFVKKKIKTKVFLTINIDYSLFLHNNYDPKTHTHKYNNWYLIQEK